MQHNIEKNGMIYKYDLPVENLPIEFAMDKALMNV